MNSPLIPLIAYLLLSIGIAFYANHQGKKALDLEKAKGKNSFLEEYFLGSRSLGGFVLAMAVTASYASASSFVGGPGVAYTLGLSWVLLAMIQVPTTFLTLGVLGSKFAKVTREMNCLTLIDYLYKRYNSSAIVLLSSLALVIFFVAAMIAQFIGGARLFQAVTGYSYEIGLILFACTVILYTTIGGFRAVAITDTLQGLVMMIASCALLIAVLQATNGVENAVQGLKAIDPGLISPYGAGSAIDATITEGEKSVPIPMMLSFWVLVGLGILGLPQTVQKCMAYKDNKSLQDAMLIGTIVIGFLLLAMHLCGAFGRVLYPNLESGDLIIPTLTLDLFSPFFAGVFIAGPMAAIMSTVDTMLLLASASIVKDLYIHFILKKDISESHAIQLKKKQRAVFSRDFTDDEEIQAMKIKLFSFITTFALGLFVFVIAHNPPDLLVWINLFAFGGLEAVFLFPFVFGLFWKRANAKGALASMIFGLSSYFFFTLVPLMPYKINAIVPSLCIAGLSFIITTLLTTRDSNI